MSFLHVRYQHDGGGSDKEVRNQQYDHTNGAKWHVGSLEEDAARTAHSPANLSEIPSRRTKRPMAGREKKHPHFAISKWSYISKPPAWPIPTIPSFTVGT
jgi:hypothetical protein